MKKLTAQEILEIIEENYSIDNFAYNELSDLIDTENEEINEIIKKGDEFNLIRNNFYQNMSEEDKRCNWEDRESNSAWIEYNSLESGYDYKRKAILTALGLGKVVEIDQYGGEDQGSTWYSVKHFVDHDVYIKTSGYYTSYHGTDFEEGYGEEVKPTQKTITVYE